MIKRINPYKRCFYHLNTTKVCRTQTMPKPYIRKKPTVSQDEILIKARNNIRETKSLWAELAKQLEQAEKERKKIDIIFIEHYIGRPLTEEEEKQKLIVYL